MAGRLGPLHDVGLLSSGSGLKSHDTHNFVWFFLCVFFVIDMNCSLKVTTDKGVVAFS